MSYPAMSTSVPWSLVQSGFHKTPHGNNVRTKTGAGRRSGYTLMPYPTWDFKLDLSFIDGAENAASVLQDFLGCYIETHCGGTFFLFTDPNDSAVTLAQGVMLNVLPGAAVPMGQTGDGVSTTFQVARTIGTGVDILQNVTISAVQINGTPTTAYTISDEGLITFTSAPAADAVLTWSGTFRYLCQFTDDTVDDLARVSKNSGGFLWSCSSIAFESVFV